jgi:hypothetical protein
MVEIRSPARRRAVGHSRVTRSIISYVGNTGGQAMRATLHSNPLRFFMQLAILCGLGSAVATSWFVFSYGSGGMHLPSLLAAVLLGVFAAALVICGILADAVFANRRLLEDALRRLKQIEASSQSAGAAAQVAALDR